MRVWFFFLMIRRPHRSKRTDTRFPYTTRVAAVGGKTNVVRFAQPCPKMTHHVEQHFVTIADQQRFHLVSSAARAAMSAPGGTSSAAAQPIRSGRSEEHTSELQSLMRISYAVFCLKKKKTQTINREYK